jgi:putative transposase
VPGSSAGHVPRDDVPRVAGCAKLLRFLRDNPQHQSHDGQRACGRHNTPHQVTTRLAKTKSALVIEGLYVSGMMKNHRLAQAIGDVSFAEFKRQLLYKASWYRARVLLADRWGPSSRRCSECGWLDADLTLSDRTFHCQQCSLLLDRDLNAAINLSKLADSSPDRINACGAVGSGARSGPRVKPAAVKQEPNMFYPLVE